MFQCLLDLPAELLTEVDLPQQVPQWLLQPPARGITASQPWDLPHTCTKAGTRGGHSLLRDKEFLLTDTVTPDITRGLGLDTDPDLVTGHMEVQEIALQVDLGVLQASTRDIHKASQATLHRVGMDLLPT